MRAPAATSRRGIPAAESGLLNGSAAPSDPSALSTMRGRPGPRVFRKRTGVNDEAGVRLTQKQSEETERGREEAPPPPAHFN
jgi:hypothetical protein